MKTAKLIAAVLVCAACDGTAVDSMLLSGSETEPLSAPGGAPTCASPKVLICHIPPGNPANAHSICVGAPAVAPHQRLHHDTLGACGPAGGAGGGSGSAGGGPAGGGIESGAGGGGVDASDAGPPIIP